MYENGYFCECLSEHFWEYSWVITAECSMLIKHRGVVWENPSVKNPYPPLLFAFLSIFFQSQLNSHLTTQNMTQISSDTHTRAHTHTHTHTHTTTQISSELTLDYFYQSGSIAYLSSSPSWPYSWYTPFYAHMYLLLLKHRQTHTRAHFCMRTCIYFFWNTHTHMCTTMHMHKQYTQAHALIWHAQSSPHRHTRTCRIG